MNPYLSNNLYIVYDTTYILIKKTEVKTYTTICSRTKHISLRFLYIITITKLNYTQEKTTKFGSQADFKKKTFFSKIKYRIRYTIKKI